MDFESAISGRVANQADIDERIASLSSDFAGKFDIKGFRAFLLTLPIDQRRAAVMAKRDEIKAALNGFFWSSIANVAPLAGRGIMDMYKGLLNL